MIRRVIKKAGAVLLAAGLSIGMFSPSVSAAVKINKTAQMKAAKNVEPEEWNKAELTAYQFDTEDDFLKYMASGGLHLYNKNYKAKDHWVKIKVADPGLFAIDVMGDSKVKIPLYDATKKKVLIKDLNGDGNGDEYSAVVKAGDEFYVKLPTKINKSIILTGVMKTEFGSMANDKSYYEVGKGTTTYHPFSIKKRSAVEFNISAIDRNSGITYAHIEKKENGQWKRIDDTVKIKPASYDDDFVHGLTKGEYRLAIKAPTIQLNAVSYTSSSKSKKVAYKKSKAKKIKLDGQTSNIYTTGEKTSRWYKISITSIKKKRILNLGKNTVSGGYEFTIYKKGKKKAIKTIKVTGNANAKTAKMPKKKGKNNYKVSERFKKA